MRYWIVLLNESILIKLNSYQTIFLLIIIRPLVHFIYLLRSYYKDDTVFTYSKYYYLKFIIDITYTILIKYDKYLKIFYIKELSIIYKN